MCLLYYVIALSAIHAKFTHMHVFATKLDLQCLCRFLQQLLLLIKVCKHLCSYDCLLSLHSPSFGSLSHVSTELDALVALQG